jgi:pimeloyl-ACP methyl ester carboxylesterase
MQHLVFLHGAIGSSAQLKALQSKLSHSFTVHLFDFPGHGGKELPGKFSIPVFAESLVEFLKEKQLSSVDIFGYSMGGYVAMHLAKHYPELVNKIATLATKFEWSEDIAAKEVKMLQPDVIEQKIPAFAETLKQRHAPQDWKQVLNRTADMLLQMGKDNPLKLDDYKTIKHQSLIMLGDKDKMVSLEETEAVADALPNAELKILSETPHPIEQVNTTILAELLTSFFKNS